MSLTRVVAAGEGGSLGRAYGEGCAAGIGRSVAFYERLAQRRGSLPSLQKQLGPFVDAARMQLPHLADEVDGVAEGAAVDPEAIWLLNCIEEVWPFEACTTVVTGRWLMHAEQWYAGHDETALVVAAPANAPAFVSPTCSGFLPAVGLSSAGFGQGIDSLTASDERTGIPRLLVSRQGLGAGSLEQAAAAARIDNRAGGYAHVLATASESLIVETTATSSADLPGGRLHTNHVLSPTLKRLASRATDGSKARLARAHKIDAQRPPATVEDCMALLADHEGEPQSICLHEDTDDPEASATVFGMVCDLEEGRVYVSDGRPCEGRWVEQAVPGFRASGVVHVG